MNILQHIGLLALLGVLSGHSGGVAWAGSNACPGTGRALMEKADRTIVAFIKATDAGDLKQQCRVSAELVVLERKLLDFYERHQTGCVIDIALIEDQQDKIRRTEGWRRNIAASCTPN